MSDLHELPQEIFLRILELSDPQDIRRCQLVCQYFRTLITQSLLIRYILTLDSLGYTAPETPRSDLILAEKIEFLEQHRRNWTFAHECIPTELVLRDEVHIYQEYVGGVYACNLQVTPGTSLVTALQFYQLPSPNLGIESREWRIPDLGVRAWGLTIDPDQDLLVLLDIPSSDSIESEGGWSEGCRVHLRTMSTNVDHPRAAAGLLPAQFARCRTSTLPYISFSFEVLGCLLAILFKSRQTGTASWVVVWDWHRGVELARLPTVEGAAWKLSFALLAPGTLLIPKFSESYHTQSHVGSDTLGSLDVYAFDPLGSTSTPPRKIASFGLPELGAMQAISTTTIKRTRPPRDSGDAKPRVYDLVSPDRLVCLILRVAPLQPHTVLWPWSAMLYVPVTVFLNSQDHLQETYDSHGNSSTDGEFVHIPWSRWAHRISWGETKIPSAPFMSGFDGQRAAIFSFSEGGSRLNMQVLDFNQMRLKWALSGTADANGEVCTPKKDTEMGIPIGRSSGETALCGDENSSPQLRYVRRVLEVDDRDLRHITIDDEHVILHKTRSGRSVLIIYTF